MGRVSSAVEFWQCCKAALPRLCALRSVSTLPFQAEEHFENALARFGAHDSYSGLSTLDLSLTRIHDQNFLWLFFERVRQWLAGDEELAGQMGKTASAGRAHTGSATLKLRGVVSLNRPPHAICIQLLRTMLVNVLTGALGIAPAEFGVHNALVLVCLPNGRWAMSDRPKRLVLTRRRDGARLHIHCSNFG